MNLATTRVALTHRCTIERDTSTTDDWGNPGEPSWEQTLEDVPCFAAVQAGREPVSTDRTVVVLDIRVIVNRDVIVSERDRIGTITDRGELLFSGPLQIEAVLPYPTHQELMVRSVTG